MSNNKATLFGALALALAISYEVYNLNNSNRNENILNDNLKAVTENNLNNFK